MNGNNDPTLVIRICWAIAILVALISLMIFIKSDFHPLVAFVCPLIISFISLTIAWLSEKRMVVIARADIMGIIRAIERARFNFYNKVHKFENEVETLNKNKSIGKKEREIKVKKLRFKGTQIIEIVIWETILCLRQTNIMKKWALKKDKDDLAYRVHILTENVFSFITINIVINRHVRYLLLCCQELSKLEISDSWKTKLICLLQKNDVGEIKPNDKNFEGYIKRKLEQINKDPAGKISREQFMNELFKGME